MLRFAKALILLTFAAGAAAADPTSAGSQVAPCPPVAPAPQHEASPFEDEVPDDPETFDPFDPTGDEVLDWENLVPSKSSSPSADGEEAQA